jgi:hypothetical protein
MSLTIKVPIPDDLVPVLERKARSAGLEREEYAGAILSRELNAPQTLDEVLAAFREQVSASGITDPELDELFRTARDEAGAQGTV